MYSFFYECLVLFWKYNFPICFVLLLICLIFLLHLNFLQGQGCFIFPLHSASWSCALGSSESGRDEVEIVRREERKRRKEAGKDRVKGRKEKTGFLAVSCCSLAKSRPAQDVNKLICQCEVFTHFGFALDCVTHAAWLCGLRCWLACCYSTGVFSLSCSRGYQDGAGLLWSL